MRTLQEVNQEYTNTCVELGDLTFKLERIPKKIEELKAKLTKLNLEAEEVINATRAKQQPASETTVPAN